MSDAEAPGVEPPGAASPGPRSPEAEQPIGEHFRHVLSHVPTGVAVVAGVGADGPAGLAVGTFTSISLEPPLVGFFCDRDSTSWPPIRATGAFCANVLSAGQGELSARFAKKGGRKFEGLEWTPSPFTGSPVLDGVLAWLDCRVEREVELGDHTLVVGTPLELVVSGEGGPLVFFRGDYPGLAG